MLLTLKRRVAQGILVAADVAGLVLSVSGAAVVAFFGRLMLAIVLGGIALGFFLRLTGRRRPPVPASLPAPMWSRLVSALLAVVAVGALVEATNFPVRFDQAGFAPWHWVLVLVALAVSYSLMLRVIGSLARGQQAKAAP